MINDLSIASLLSKIKAKKISISEVIQEYLTAIKERDPNISAFLSVFKEEAMERAKLLENEKTDVVPPLFGVPLAIKDNMMIRGTRTTAASKILETYTASYDATVIEKLKNAGSIFLGKTNLDEFAMGSSTENSAFQITKNPLDVTRVPGGSSGGSAAAVADGLALAALGSDTGGSVRQPAAFCGVVGLKPTYGAVSRFGLIAMASSLDQIGPFTKTVEDAALLFDVIRGKDEHDGTSIDFDFKIPDIASFSDRKPVIGIPKEYFIEGLDTYVASEIESVRKWFKKNGFTVKEVSLPNTSHALSVYYIIMPAEVSTNLARFDGIRYARIPDVSGKNESLKELYLKNRGLGFGPETRRRILLGTFVLSSGYYDAYYAKAQKVRRLIRDDFEKVFDPSADGVDILLAPTTPTTAFKIGEKTEDPLSMYLSDIFTIPVNLAGLPAISIPVRGYNPNAKKMPVGFQLIGKRFHEEDILGLGMFYEQNR